MIPGIEGVAAVRWKEKHAACLPRFERLNEDEHTCHYAKRFSTTTATAALTSSITPLGNMMVSDSTRIVTKARSTAVAGVTQQISQSGTFRRVSNLNVSAGHYWSVTKPIELIRWDDDRPAQGSFDSIPIAVLSRSLAQDAM